MLRLKRCWVGIGVGLCWCAIALARPPLTTVQDVLYKADGAKYEGIATISWQSFEAVDSSTIPTQTITIRIVNGFLRVQLVPTTNAITPSSYTVVYNSDGKAQFVENWIVPPSNVPVRVREVRVGGPGSVIGGSPIPPVPLTSVQLSDVVGLAAALNIRPSLGTGFTPSRTAVINSAGSIDGALGNLSDCVHVDGSAAACGGGSVTTTPIGFVDGEIPAGAIDSSNAVFALTSAPNPPSSLKLFRNGMLFRQGVDYTLSSATVTFVSRGIPLTGDVLVASYRVAVSIAGITFVDAEVPAGAVDGINSAFLLSLTPNPAASLEVYRNGLHLRMNLDYTVSGSSIIFQTGQTPQAGDVLLTSYRTVVGIPG